MCSRLTDVGKMGNARMNHTRGRAPMWLSDKDTEIGESDIKVISKYAASSGIIRQNVEDGGMDDSEMVKS